MASQYISASILLTRERAECQEQVVKFTGAKFRKFFTEEEAWSFVDEQDSATGQSFQISPNATSGGGMNNQLGFKLQSVLSTSDLFKHQLLICKQQLSSLTSLGEKLTSEVEDLKSSMPLSPHTLSPGPHGLKRSFSSANDKDAFAPQPPKKPTLKKNKSEKVDSWTGQRFNEDDGVIVYTDGACSCNGKNGARAGIGVFWGPGDSRNLSERLTGRPTNNRAEIHAARRAVEQAKAYGTKNVILHTDSQFLINSITTWVKGWKRNGWVKTTGEAVINKEDFIHLDSVIKDMNIKWVYVKGHYGIPGNEAADKLANEGARKSLPTD